VETGLASLDGYLDLVAGDRADSPVFLTDHEIAQLYLSGTSWRVKGGLVIVRNATHSTRILAIPTVALVRAAAARGDEHTSRQPVLVSLPAGTNLDLIP